MLHGLETARSSDRPQRPGGEGRQPVTFPLADQISNREFGDIFIQLFEHLVGERVLSMLTKFGRGRLIDLNVAAA